MEENATSIVLDLERLREGSDRESLDRLVQTVYQELRRLARSFLRREHQVSIQTTELVHEAYVKLTNQRTVDWRNHGQFFALAAQAMRRIMIDAARQRQSLKHGVDKVSLENALTIVENGGGEATDLIDLDNALTELEAFDSRQCRIVELRYFAGLTVEETAEVMDVSAATVKREWAIARSWLFRRINP